MPLDWEKSTINQMLYGRSGEVARDVEKRGRAVLRRAKSAAPVRTGALRSSFELTMETTGDGPVARVTSSSDHFWFVELGTGIYGRGGQIDPTRKKALRWTGKRGEVFSEKARGMRARPFFAEAVEAAR